MVSTRARVVLARFAKPRTADAGPQTPAQLHQDRARYQHDVGMKSPRPNLFLIGLNEVGYQLSE